MPQKVIPENGMRVRWVRPGEDLVSAEYVERTLIPICGREEMALRDVKPVSRSDEYLVTVCKNGKPLCYPVNKEERNKQGKLRNLKARTVRIQWFLLRKADG